MNVLDQWEAEKLQRRLRQMPGWAYRQVEKAALEDHMSVFEYVLVNSIDLEPDYWDIKTDWDWGTGDHDPVEEL